MPNLFISSCSFYLSVFCCLLLFKCFYTCLIIIIPLVCSVYICLIISLLYLLQTTSHWSLHIDWSHWLIKNIMNPRCCVFFLLQPPVTHGAHSYLSSCLWFTTTGWSRRRQLLHDDDDRLAHTVKPHCDRSTFVEGPQPLYFTSTNFSAENCRIPVRLCVHTDSFICDCVCPPSISYPIHPSVFCPPFCSRPILFLCSDYYWCLCFAQVQGHPNKLQTFDFVSYLNSIYYVFLVFFVYI